VICHSAAVVASRGAYPSLGAQAPRAATARARVMSHAPRAGDSPFALTLGDPLASDTPLQLGQLGLAAHVHTTLAGSSSTVVGALPDPLALVLRQGAQEGDEASADARREVQVWLVEHLDHGALCVHTIHHRAGGAVPFGNGAEGFLAVLANVPIQTSTAPPHSKTRSASEAVLQFANRVTEAMCQFRTRAPHQIAMGSRLWNAVVLPTFAVIATESPSAEGRTTLFSTSCKNWLRYFLGVMGTAVPIVGIIHGFAIWAGAGARVGD